MNISITEYDISTSFRAATLDRETAEAVSNTIQSATFWRNVKMVTAMVLPIMQLLRLVDSGAPVMGKVYYLDMTCRSVDLVRTSNQWADEQFIKIL